MSVEKEKTKALLGGARWALSGQAEFADIGDISGVTTYGLSALESQCYSKDKSAVRIRIGFFAYVDPETAREILKTLTDKDYIQDLILAGI